jgi:hypothetical protein
MSALSHFLPTILGGVIGAALEGSEGLAAGLEGGLKGTKLVGDIEKQQAETELIKAKTRRGGGSVSKAQQTDFVDKQGDPISFDPTTRQYTKVDGTPAQRGDFTDPISARQAKSLERTDKKIAMSEIKLKHGIKKDTQLSDPQVKRLEEMNVVNSAIDRIKALQKEVSTGLGVSQFQSLAEFADAAPKEFTAMKSETTSVLADYVKSISGAQVSVQEAKRLQGVIPSTNDAPDVFDAKLKTFKRIVEANKTAFKNAIISGQPMKAGTIRGLDKAEKEAQSNTQTARQKRIAELRKKAGK